MLCPPLINDASEAAFIADVAAEIVGPNYVNRQCELAMGSEDFSLMLEGRAGAFIGIGNGNEPGSCGLHTSGYDFNDAILPLGASIYAKLVEGKLATL
jgi:metal-dependent amidase/aminoacylase/carboxypeptidase family protein